jgi:hypothetical protein
MLAVARKTQYLAYPVVKDWCKDVRAWLDDQPRGTQEKMRKYIVSRGLKCSSGELSEVLDGKAQTSEFVAPIHEFIKWPPPLSPSASRDAGEVLYHFERETPEQRAFVLAAAELIEGKSGDDARLAIETFLAAFRARQAKND